MKQYPILLAPLLLAGFVLAGSAPSLAQMGAGMTSSGGAGAPSTKANRTNRVQDVPPPAMPGARAEPAAVAPATKAGVDMPPTEALFDAINRGDLPGAKDAVNRGADINGNNVLGLTPLELAVDLGRNDISFLLLSLRGGSGYTTTRGPVANQPAAGPTRAERQAADRADRAERAARARSAQAQPAAPAAPQTARLFAGNGGAPIPQAGFLGFDANR